MISLHLPAPCPPINANQRLHFRIVADRVRRWREAAHVRAKAAGLESYDHAHVTAVCHFTDARRRDVANWAGTAKACVDGLIDAGVLKDDSDAFLVGPDMRTGDRAVSFSLTLRIDPDCACLDCAHRWGPRLQLITNDKGETR